MSFLSRWSGGLVCALRSKASTCRWARHYNRWLFAFPAAGNWRQFTGQNFFSAGGCSGIRDGNHGSAADHDRYELLSGKPRWDRIGSEQRRRTHGESDRNRSSRSRHASRVQNRSGSQIDQREFASSVVQSVQTQSTRLAAIDVPQNLNDETRQVIRRAIDESFVSDFAG